MKNIFKKTKGNQDEGAKVKKIYTRRFYLMITSGVIVLLGFVFFILYLSNLNMVMGMASIVMMVGGIFAFRHYWNKDDNLAVEYIKDGLVSQEDSANCFNIYKDKVLFETMLKPEGFPMECINLGKRYYVNIMDPITKRLTPFVLPDQQFYDPNLFAQRVLGLPCHKKIFERKPKLIQRLKTALLVAAIFIVWLLILTTTGS